MRPSTSEYRSPSTGEPTIPCRFREHLFREIAPFISTALHSFPNAVEVLTTLTNETFRRRFTEAIEAKRRYGWKHDDIVDESFLKLYSKLRTAIIDDKLFIGSLEALKLLRANSKTAETLGVAIKPKPESSNAIPIEVPLPYLQDFAEILSIFVPRPTNFFVRNLGPNQQSYYESKYDIGFAQDEANKTIFHIL